MPGARIDRVRRLRGGLGAHSHVLTLRLLDGTRRRVVLRRYLDRENLTPERAEREVRILEMVNKSGIPAATPIGLDVKGEYFDRPALLLSYLHGRPLLEPRDAVDWSRQLASTMLDIHAVTPSRVDLRWLPTFSREDIRAELLDLKQDVDASEPLALEVHNILRRDIDCVRWPEPCLIHEDFWPGNTVWRGQRITGVIDWINAKLGDARCDVTQCCVDTLLVQGDEVARSLCETYQRLAPEPLPDMWYFDLFNGLRALLYSKVWLIGYHDAGLTHITEELVHERLQRWLRGALKEAARA